MDVCSFCYHAAQPYESWAQTPPHSFSTVLELPSSTCMAHKVEADSMYISTAVL